MLLTPEQEAAVYNTIVKELLTYFAPGMWETVLSEDEAASIAGRILVAAEDALTEKAS